MIEIKTHIDHLFNFIEKNSPVKENKIPRKLKNIHNFEKFIDILEDNGMIEVKMPIFSERTFVFKCREGNLERSSWDLKILNF